MAGPALTTAAGTVRRLPAFARIAVVYLAARAITLGMFWLATVKATPQSHFGGRPSVGTLLMGWDAQWYWFIAVHGYPSTLPVDDHGLVTQNQWAFMPVYPYLVRLFGGAGVGWTVAAVIISLVAGFGACLVLHAMLAGRISESARMWAVVFFACAPMAALFQIGYAESLFLLELFLALWALMRRRYVWLYPLIAVMAFTRPGVLAFALMLAGHLVVRWFTRHRERLGPAEFVHIIAAGLWGAALGLAWPQIAGWVTGRPDAYLATELSWRRGWGLADAPFAPFRAFFDAAQMWFEMWGLGRITGVVVLVLAILAVAVLLLFGPRVRRLGSEIRLWSASYVLYLLAVFFPQSSIVRLLVPLSPLWGAAVPRSRGWRLAVLGLCLVGQWWWIYNMYAQGTATWQIP